MGKSYHKFWNNPDRKVASNAGVVNDEGRLVTKGDFSFNRGRGNYRGRGYGRRNNRGQGIGVGNKFKHATWGGHRLDLCKVKDKRSPVTV